MNEFDCEKFSKGLELRLELARHTATRTPISSIFSRVKDSISREYHCKHSNVDIYETRKNSQDIWLSETALEVKNIKYQLEIFNRFINFTNANYLPHIILGSIYKPETLPAITDVDSAMDMSLYAQYLMYIGEIEPEDGIVEIIRNYYRKVNYLILGDESVSAKTLQKKIRKSKNENTLSSVFDYIFNLKLGHWYLFGVDVLDLALSLVSPHRSLRRPSAINRRHFVDYTGWHEFIISTSNAWSKSKIYAGWAQSQQFAKDIPVTARDGHDLAARRMFSDIRKPPLKAWTAFSEEYLGITSQIISNAEKAFQEDKINIACKWLCTLARIDKSHFFLLDWKVLDQLMPAGCGEYTFSRAFVELQFIDFANDNYPDVVGDRGVGTFEGVLAELIERLRQDGKTLKQILLEVQRSLPSPSARILTENLVSRETLEHFAEKIPLERTARRPDETIPKLSEEDRLMRLRVNIAIEAEKIGLLSPAFRSDVLGHEKHLLAVRKIKQHFSKGRIRPPWRALQNKILRTAERIVKHHESVRDSVVEIFDDNFTRALDKYRITELVEELLFEGANSVDYILGANLRHGVIVTAYMSAFSKSVDSIVSVGKLQSDWQSIENQTLLGGAYHILNNAKSNIYVSLKEYINYWLTIESEGQLPKRLFDSMYNETLNELNSAELNLQRLTNRLFEAFQSDIASFFEEARQQFEAVRAPFLEKIAADVRAQLHEKADNKALVGDMLLREIRDLNGEIPSWINVVLEEKDMDNFTASQLISMESELFHLRPPEEDSVSLICEAMIDGKKKILTDVLFKGDSFNLLNEIVHNLYLNAVNYSGYGRDTKMVFTIKLSPEGLEIIAVNNMTQEAVEKAHGKWQHALTMAQSEVAVNAIGSERKDVGSGFAKIRTIANEYLDKPINIELTQPSKNKNGYKVAVKIRGSTKDIVHDATYTDSGRRAGKKRSSS